MLLRLLFFGAPIWFHCFKAYKTMQKKIFLLLPFLLAFCSPLLAQDFMMQGWYWDYDKNGCNGYSGPSWAARLQGQASTLGNAGFTYLWLPPLSRASFGACSNGYDPKDLYDLGEYGLGPTGFGTRAEVDGAITALAANGIQSVADVVYNHRDGGVAEDNPAVKAYMEVHFNGGGKSPFPSDRYRYRLPLGTTYGAGDYYIKVKSKTESYGAFEYKFYPTIASSSLPYQGEVNETEPNGGGDCGQTFNPAILNQDIIATLFDFSGCYTDEFKLSISNADFNSAGDDLLIFMNNTGGYSDHYIYGIYYEPANGNPGFNIPLADLKIQTYTDFTQLPSGQGGMNFENFRPNSANTATTFMNGDWDQPLFFYDVVQEQPSTATVYNDWSAWLMNNVGIGGLRMDAIKHFPPAFVAQLLDDLHGRGLTPGMVVGEFFDSSPNLLSDWVTDVTTNMSSSTADVRIFDFTLREALKQACDNGSYDARDLFNSSLRDATALTGFNAVTFVNNHDFRYAGEPVQNDPMLAYAYILTNNQVGVPCVFYPDFFGTSIPNAPTVNLSAPISELIQIHKDHIFGAPEVVYLNRFLSSQFGDYQIGSPNQGVIYQIKGGVGAESVIVAINFGYGTLKVDQEIDLSANVNPGATFIDLTGNAFQTMVSVSNQNRLLIDVPARSYAVYVLNQGALPAELISFEARLNREKAVDLRWESSLEEHLAYYQIEVSTDNGRHFSSLARLAARGPSQYQYQDSSPWEDHSKRQYRLRMVDIDGQEEFSSIRTVQLPERTAATLVVPNPTADWVEIKNIPDDAPWALYQAADGRQLSVPSRRLPNGLQLDLRTLPTGLYLFSSSQGAVRVMKQ